MSGGLNQTLAAAARSRKQDFALPLVRSTDEAAALAREIVVQVRHLPDDQRLLLLTSIHELCQMLERRLDVLERDMAETRQQLLRIEHGVRASNGYANSVGLNGPARGIRR